MPHEMPLKPEIKPRYQKLLKRIKELAIIASEQEDSPQYIRDEQQQLYDIEFIVFGN